MTLALGSVLSLAAPHSAAHGVGAGMVHSAVLSSKLHAPQAAALLSDRSEAREFMSPAARAGLRRSALVGLGGFLLAAAGGGVSAAGVITAILQSRGGGVALTIGGVAMGVGGLAMMGSGIRRRKLRWQSLSHPLGADGYVKPGSQLRLRHSNVALTVGIPLALGSAAMLTVGLTQRFSYSGRVDATLASLGGVGIAVGTGLIVGGAVGRRSVMSSMSADRQVGRVQLGMPTVTPKRSGASLAWSGRF